jgi:hypothetical protein
VKVGNPADRQRSCDLTDLARLEPQVAATRSSLCGLLQARAQVRPLALGDLDRGRPPRPRTPFSAPIAATYSATRGELDRAIADLGLKPASTTDADACSLASHAWGGRVPQYHRARRLRPRCSPSSRPTPPPRHLVSPGERPPPPRRRRRLARLHAAALALDPASLPLPPGPHTAIYVSGEDYRSTSRPRHA